MYRLSDRLARLRAEMTNRGLQALLVAKPENRAYLSDFTGSYGLLVITDTVAQLLTDSRYVEQATVQAPEFQVVRQTRGAAAAVDAATKLVAATGAKRAGFEDNFLSVSDHRGFAEAMPEVNLVPAGGLVERLRSIKDAAEIAATRRAAALADAAFDHVLSFIRPGVVEREIALELEFFMKRQGAEDLAFETIVASGPRSSLPHGVASDRIIGIGDLVTLDFGCRVSGYCSDMTRTVMVGEPDEKQRSIYELVLAAQTQGVAAARPGLSCRALDAVCRGTISQQGFGEFFDHSTGHGVGREVHEEPRVAGTSIEELRPGQIVTVEPGIYLPGWGGVRIEDLLLITPEGHEVLSRSPKALIIVE